MTREEIIRNLKYTMEKHKNDIVETFGTNISVMCKDILDYLEQEPKWIPVLERSPEKSGKYLAYIINKKDNKLQYIMTCEYLVDGYWHWFPDDECASDNVIAWMPLPEPYKAESEGEG